MNVEVHNYNLMKKNENENGNIFNFIKLWVVFILFDETTLLPQVSVPTDQ